MSVLQNLNSTFNCCCNHFFVKPFSGWLDCIACWHLKWTKNTNPSHPAPLIMNQTSRHLFVNTLCIQWEFQNGRSFHVGHSLTVCRTHLRILPTTNRCVHSHTACRHTSKGQFRPTPAQKGHCEAAYCFANLVDSLPVNSNVPLTPWGKKSVCL